MPPWLRLIPTVHLCWRISASFEDKASFADLDLAQRFRRIHDTNLWGAAASASGLGSEMDATGHAARRIAAAARKSWA